MDNFWLLNLEWKIKYQNKIKKKKNSPSLVAR